MVCDIIQALLSSPLSFISSPNSLASVISLSGDDEVDLSVGKLDRRRLNNNIIYTKLIKSEHGHPCIITRWMSFSDQLPLLSEIGWLQAHYDWYQCSVVQLWKPALVHKLVLQKDQQLLYPVALLLEPVVHMMVNLHAYKSYKLSYSDYISLHWMVWCDLFRGSMLSRLLCT